MYDGISIEKVIYLPNLVFHWPEPDFVIETISYWPILMSQLKIEEYLFEPVFPWVHKNSDNVLIIDEKEEKLI